MRRSERNPKTMIATLNFKANTSTPHNRATRTRTPLRKYPEGFEQPVEATISKCISAKLRQIDLDCVAAQRTRLSRHRSKLSVLNDKLSPNAANTTRAQSHGDVASKSVVRRGGSKIRFNERVQSECGFTRTQTISEMAGRFHGQTKCNKVFPSSTTLTNVLSKTDLDVDVDIAKRNRRGRRKNQINQHSNKFMPDRVQVTDTSDSYSGYAVNKYTSVQSKVAKPLQNVTSTTSIAPKREIAPNLCKTNTGIRPKRCVSEKLNPRESNREFLYVKSLQKNSNSDPAMYVKTHAQDTRTRRRKSPWTGQESNKCCLHTQKAFGGGGEMVPEVKKHGSNDTGYKSATPDKRSPSDEYLHYHMDECDEPARIENSPYYNSYQSVHVSPYRNIYTNAAHDPEKARILLHMVDRTKKQKPDANAIQETPTEERLIPEAHSAQISRVTHDMMDAYLQESYNSVFNRGEHDKKPTQPKKANRAKNGRSSSVLSSLPMEGLPTDNLENYVKFKQRQESEDV